MPNTAPAGSGAAGFTQGLLGALQPWLTGGSPSALDTSFAQDGGLTGLLSAMLQDGPGSTGATAFGKALQANQTDAMKRAVLRQSLAKGQIGLTESAMMLPYLKNLYGMMDGATGQTAPNPGAPAPGSSNAPAQTPASGGTSTLGSSAAQPAPSASNGASPAAALLLARAQSRPPAGAGAASTAPNPFTIPSYQSISAVPVGGMPGGFYFGNAIISGKSPLKAMSSLYGQQLKVEQQKYGPVLGELDTLDKAQSPTQYVQASPMLMAEWHQLAPTLGYDPVKGFTDPNVRTAFAFLRNRIAGALGESTVAPPVEVGTTPGPLGSIFQRNPITGQLTQVKPEEALKAIVGPKGTVRYVAASQAAGQTPYESELYAPPQSIDQTASMIAKYQMAPLNGYALRTPIGAEIMAKVKAINPNYDATTYQTKQAARTAFAVGKQGNMVRSLSVATNHLDQLAEAAHALAQHDVPAINAIVNTYARHTGNASITTFNAMKEIVGDEVAKAVIGSGGAESDRDAIKDAFNSANSPKQIAGVISHYEGLMGGQLNGLRRQYKRATGLDDFNDLVSRLAQQKLTAAGRAGTGAVPKALNVGQSTQLGQFKVTRIR